MSTTRGSEPGNQDHIGGNRHEESSRTVEEQWLVRAGHELRHTGPRGSRDKLHYALATVGTAEPSRLQERTGMRVRRGLPQRQVL